jgi:hypothetical protein
MHQCNTDTQLPERPLPEPPKCFAYSTCVGYLGHPFTKLPVSLSLVLSTDVFRLCNFPKVLFLKLARIPVLFLILGRKFLMGEGSFSAPSRSFYSKVRADGTLRCDVYCNRGIKVKALLSVEKVRVRVWRRPLSLWNKLCIGPLQVQILKRLV